MNNSVILAELDPVKEIAVHKLFSITIAGREIIFSNHMLMVSVACIMLMIGLPMALAKGGLTRKGWGNFIEGICLYLRDEVAKPFLGEQTDRYIGFLWTLFFFIVTLNLLGLVPLEKFFSLFAGKPVHLGGAATANIWITGALAVMSTIMVHISGIKSQGFFTYFRNFAPPVPLFIKPFVYLIEIMSSFIKPFALAVRLFANIFAGHVLLSVILSFILIFKNFAVVGPSITFAVLMSFIELFVACLQAYIFTFLTTIFISFAVVSEH